MSEAKKSLMDMLLVVGGKISTIGVVFLGGFLAARFGTMEDYGLFTTMISAILLIDGVIGAPLDIGAVRFASLDPGNIAKSEGLEGLGLRLKLVVALVLFCIGLVFFGGTWHYLLVSIVSVSLLVMRSVATSLQIRKRFRDYSLIDILVGAGRLLGFGCLLAFGAIGGAEFIGVYGVVTIIAVVVTVWIYKQGYLFKYSANRGDAQQMIKYCGLTAGVVALGAATGRGDLLVLANWFPEGEIATYAAASQLFLLMAQLSLYMSIVTQPKLMAWETEGVLGKAFLINLAFVAFVAMPVILLAWNIEWLRIGLNFIFGDGYEGAAPLLSILMFGGLIDLLMVPVLMMYVLQTMPSIALLSEVLVAILFVLVSMFVLSKTDPALSQLGMAWLAVGLRGVKCAVYAVCFFVKTRNRKSVRLEGAVT